MTFEKVSIFLHASKHVLLKICGTMKFSDIFVRTVIFSKRKISQLKLVLVSVNSTGMIIVILIDLTRKYMNVTFLTPF